jgi:DNA-binding NarL/FixJ family response regulator
LGNFGKDMEILHTAILENYQSIIDGYHYRFDQDPAIKITAEARYGEQLEEMLINNPVDILLIEPFVPVSKTNRNYFPVWLTLCGVKEKWPHVKILVITGNNDSGNVRNAVDIGVNGYIFKEEAQAIHYLADAIKFIAFGSHLYSQLAQKLLQESFEETVNLSRRQLCALSLCAAYPNEQLKHLAGQLEITHSTFRSTLSRAYAKLNVHSRMGAVDEARRRGWI